MKGNFIFKFEYILFEIVNLNTVQFYELQISKHEIFNVQYMREKKKGGLDLGVARDALRL